MRTVRRLTTRRILIAGLTAWLVPSYGVAFALSTSGTLHTGSPPIAFNSPAALAVIPFFALFIGWVPLFSSFAAWALLHRAGWTTWAHAGIAGLLTGAGTLFVVGIDRFLSDDSLYGPEIILIIPLIGLVVGLLVRRIAYGAGVS